MVINLVFRPVGQHVCLFQPDHCGGSPWNCCLPVEISGFPAPGEVVPPADSGIRTDANIPDFAFFIYIFGRRKQNLVIFAPVTHGITSGFIPPIPKPQDRFFNFCPCFGRDLISVFVQDQVIDQRGNKEHDEGNYQMFPGESGFFYLSEHMISK